MTVGENDLMNIPRRHNPPHHYKEQILYQLGVIRCFSNKLSELKEFTLYSAGKYFSILSRKVKENREKW